MPEKNQVRNSLETEMASTCMEELEVKFRNYRGTMEVSCLGYVKRQSRFSGQWRNMVSRLQEFETF